jgi:Lrp/AsnC family leucine-responsive transcriptional regulator
MKRLRNESGEIDSIDAKILMTLSLDARTSLAEIGRIVGMSAPSVAERVRRLEDVGAIQGYSIRIDPVALGFPLEAWLRIRPLPGELARVTEILKAIQEIVRCDRVTGEDCFIAHAHLRSVAHLENIIDRIIPFAMTNTSIVQSSPIPSRLPPVAFC